MKRYLPIFIVIVFLALSCNRKVVNSYDSIRFVDDLLNDSLPAMQKLASAAGESDGSIFLVGEPLECLSLSEEMMVFDGFDNVDARQVKDGLPDFAGETIVSLLDFANAPYDSLYPGEAGKLALREVAVRDALAAIDSSIRCKVIILCSSELAENGGDDISNFFEQIGCDVPVIYSTDSAFSYSETCFRIMREKNLFTHKIAYPVADLLMTVRSASTKPFETVSFEDRLVPSSFADTVGVFAPNTFVSYVQNKHKP